MAIFSESCRAWVVITPFPLVPCGAAYVSILLSEVEQEQRPSGNGECDVEVERAYTVYDPIFIYMTPYINL